MHVCASKQLHYAVDNKQARAKDVEQKTVFVDVEKRLIRKFDACTL